MANRASKYPYPISEDEFDEPMTAANNDAIFDIRVVEACQEGSGLAWHSFYEAHFDFVFKVARRLGTPTSEAEDVAYEVFTLAYQKISDFHGDKVENWLFGITVDLVSKRHKARRRRKRFARFKAWFSTKPMENPDQRAQRAAAAKAVSTIMQHMNSAKRNVFALFEIEALDADEIAERLDCASDSVNGQIHAARKEFLAVAKRMGYLKGAQK